MPQRSVDMRSHVQKLSHCFNAVLSLRSREVESVSIMVCSPGVNQDGRRDSLQGVGCGKEVLNYWINVCTGRWVSLEAASTSMFSTSGMRFMDAWIFA